MSGYILQNSAFLQRVLFANCNIKDKTQFTRNLYLLVQLCSSLYVIAIVQ